MSLYGRLLETWYISLPVIFWNDSNKNLFFWIKFWLLWLIQVGLALGHLPEHGGRSDPLVLNRQLRRRRLLPLRNHHHDHHQNSEKVKQNKYSISHMQLMHRINRFGSNYLIFEPYFCIKSIHILNTQFLNSTYELTYLKYPLSNFCLLIDNIKL